MTTVLEETEAARPAARKSRRRAKNQLLKLVRRIHLYSGILLLPWVLLYGVTALLFNHPEVATQRTRVDLGSSLVRGTEFAEGFDARVLADELLTAWNEDRKKDDPLVLDASFAPRFTRPLFIDSDSEERSARIRFDASDGSGRLTTRERRAPRDRAPFLDRKTFMQPASWPNEDAWKEAAATVVERAGFEGEDFRVRSGPTLRFHVRDGDEVWVVDGDLGRRRASASKVSDRRPMTTRSFLLRLHTAHVFPDTPGWRWAWALIVDVMAIAMVFWAASGLLMWWQLKSTRLAGFALLAASLLGAGLVGAGMWSLMN